VYAKHIEDCRDVTLDRTFGYVELSRDHLVRKTFCHQREYFFLSRAQRSGPAGVGGLLRRLRALQVGCALNVIG
jgi:hypothetical protein